MNISLRNVLHLLLFLALSLTILHTSSDRFLSLEVDPDSVEYACSAREFAEHGTLAIPVEGVQRPPRYSPFYPIAGVSWFFKIDGRIASLRYLVAGYGILCLVSAWMIGKAAAGLRGAWCCGTAIMLSGLFRYFLHVETSDVPSMAFILLSLYCYLRIVRRTSSTADFLFAGVLGAWAGFRMTGLAALIPFAVLLRSDTHAIRKLIALSLAPLALLSWTASYNFDTFGSVWRSGYNYWLPVPYDFPSLVFGPRYLLENLKLVATKTECFFLLLAIAGALFVLRNKLNKTISFETRAALLFVSLTALPITLFYLCYFFPTNRFYIPVEVLLLVLLGLIVSEFLINSTRLLFIVLPCVLLLASYGAANLISAPAWNDRFAHLQKIEAHTNYNSLVISGINPVYAACVQNDRSQRTYLPVSRRVEYASKLIAVKALLPSAEAPLLWTDARWKELPKLGAVEPISSVAIDDAQTIVEALQSGRPVFVDTNSITAAEQAALKEKYEFGDPASGIASLQGVRMQ